MDTMAVGSFLAALRHERNLTQEQLGEALGVSGKTVSRWETGAHLPPVESLARLSELYSVSINEILSARRLSDTEYRAAAEENLTVMVRESAFTREEQEAYFRRKWQTDHDAVQWILCAAMLVLFAAAFYFRSLYLIGAFFIALPILFAWRHNAMMIYVEGHLYGTTQSGDTDGQQSRSTGAQQNGRTDRE